MVSHSENSLTAENHTRHCSDKESTNLGRVISIDMLPDEVLLEMFDFYVIGDLDGTRKQYYEVWQPLVHVCRRWRSIVFGSPCRLDLRLVCTAKTPARDSLDVWPDLPLSIECGSDYRVDDIIAVLERTEYVEEIELFDVDSSSRSKEVLAAMQEPFPYLRELELRSKAGTVPILLPDSLLGRSAPRLDILSLNGIPFPGLPKLLLSATRLVVLRLDHIPHSGYISPKAMLTTLSKLTSLESLCLGFHSFLYRPSLARQRLPHFVLPVLTFFRFEGDSEYLEDLVAYIEAPQLNGLHTMFFNETVFDAPQLFRFIRCTSKLKSFEKASVIFEDGSVRIYLWQFLNVEQVCTSDSPPPSFPADRHNYKAQYFRPDWQDSIEDTLWLELLLPFGAVKYLYLSEEFIGRIVPTLHELVSRKTTGALPTLQNVLLEGLPASGPVQDGIQQFVASQQVFGHPIAVSHWDRLGDRTGFQEADG